MSSSERDPTELAALLARKAEQDAAAVRGFAASSEIADGIIGFHAQQAVEKWLKAVIAIRGRTFEYTHDLDHLVELATADEKDLPVDVDELVPLTEYAVPLRYEGLLDAEPLDRDATVELVDQVGRWAAAQLGSAPRDR